MIDYLISLDTQAFLALNGLIHCPYLDGFMKYFSGKLVWVPMYASLIFIIFRLYGWREALIITLAAATTIAATDQVGATLLRPIFERLRPANPANPISDLVHIVDGYRGGSYGFPSCHAANSFALATFMSLIAGRRSFTWGIFGWATINSLSRVYLGVHYPGDLLFGALVGCSVAALFYLALRWAVKERPVFRKDALTVFFAILGATVCGIAIAAAVRLFA